MIWIFAVIVIVSSSNCMVILFHGQRIQGRQNTAAVISSCRSSGSKHMIIKSSTNTTFSCSSYLLLPLPTSLLLPPSSYRLLPLTSSYLLVPPPPPCTSFTTATTTTTPPSSISHSNSPGCPRREAEGAGLRIHQSTLLRWGRGRKGSA